MFCLGARCVVAQRLPETWRIGKRSVTILSMDAIDALADPVRRDRLVAVAGGRRRVVDLAADQRITRPAVSRHLRLLTDAGLLDVQDHGRERHYRLRPQARSKVQDFLDRLQQISFPTPLSAGALAALDTEVRRTVRARRAAPSPRPREDTA